MEELWNKLGAWGYAVPILMLLCLNILLFTDIFEKIIIRCWVYLENIIRKRKINCMISGRGKTSRRCGTVPERV